MKASPSGKRINPQLYFLSTRHSDRLNLLIVSLMRSRRENQKRTRCHAWARILASLFIAGLTASNGSYPIR
ncbi:MAG: hypothetical protein LAO31_11175 [Acidobacteriia bacterium]|nr:hypothetical protein [Terriglobia bacterium]